MKKLLNETSHYINAAIFNSDYFYSNAIDLRYISLGQQLHRQPDETLLNILQLK